MIETKIYDLRDRRVISTERMYFNIFYAQKLSLIKAFLYGLRFLQRCRNGEKDSNEEVGQKDVGEKKYCILAGARLYIA